MYYFFLLLFAYFHNLNWNRFEIYPKWLWYVVLTVPSFNPPKSKRQRKYRSIISEVFDGTIVSSVQCLTCDRVSDWCDFHLNNLALTKWTQAFDSSDSREKHFKNNRDW